MRWSTNVAGSDGQGHRGARAKDTAVRLFCRLAAGAYLRVRVDGRERLPVAETGGYIICFNHPSWTDPIILLGAWPDRGRRFLIFGPRERDMTIGRRNALITWTERGVPFQPGGSDIAQVTRNAARLLRSGAILAIAGEGRLSDVEGQARPLEVGVAHFALMAGVPIVPVAVSGTRRIRFGKTVRILIGMPIHGATEVDQSRRAAAQSLIRRTQDELQRLLDELAPHDDRETGRFGAWLSEVFNERPWLDVAAGPPISARRTRRPADAVRRTVHRR